MTAAARTLTDADLVAIADAATAAVRAIVREEIERADVKRRGRRARPRVRSTRAAAALSATIAPANDVARAAARKALGR